MIKINITRSQVAQLFVELTNDNLKEVFIVEGDEVAEAATTPDVPAIGTTPEETPAAAPEEVAESTDAPAETESPVEETPAAAPEEVAESTDAPAETESPVEETPAA